MFFKIHFCRKKQQNPDFYHITEGKNTGVRELEKFFLSFSEKMDITINVIGFKINIYTNLNIRNI